MADAKEILRALKEAEDAERAKRKAEFFRTGKGQYGEGDKFLGLTVPQTRSLVRKFRGTEICHYEELLKSSIHEVRLFALISLGEEFRKADMKDQQRIYEVYMANTDRVNNWDLVDTSAPHIAGAWLWNRDRSKLFELARSVSLWDRRIAIIATQFFIRKNDFSDTLRISDILLHDTEDLIHKAVGWMLREVGNRNRELEECFLKSRYTGMPRTMLRYAIEKFEPEIRRMYLKGFI